MLLYYYVNTNAERNWAHYIGSRIVGFCFPRKNGEVIHLFRLHFSFREHELVLKLNLRKPEVNA